MGELRDFIWCTTKHNLTKKTLNNYQPDKTTKTTQVFNKGVKSLIKSNTPGTPHKVILRNQETEKKIIEST